MLGATHRTGTLWLATLVSILFGIGGVAGQSAASAQVAVFACAPATPGASPAATAVMPVPSPSPPPFPASGGELTVFAAASLTDAFERIGEDLAERNPGLTITYNFAGSQALATQLREGAAADVFASANEAQMATAIADGVIAGEPAIFARNRLAIVLPADNPAGLDEPGDLGQTGLRLVLAQPEVPAGRYAREAICRMAADVVTYGDGVAERVAGNVVSEEEDVRDVLTKVRLGEADAGVVYASDARAAGNDVAVIEIPDAVNVHASYPIAAVANGDTDLAAAFMGFVLGAEGQAVLADFGFEADS